LLIVFRLGDFEISDLPRVLRNKQLATHPEQIVATLVRENLMIRKEVSPKQGSEKERKSKPSLQQKIDKILSDPNIQWPEEQAILPPKATTKQDVWKPEKGAVDTHKKIINGYYAALAFYLIFSISLLQSTSEDEQFIGYLFFGHAIIGVAGCIFIGRDLKKMGILSTINYVAQLIILVVMLGIEIGDLEIVLPLNLFIIAVFLFFSISFFKKHRRSHPT
jgi:hypothetical protein